MMVYVCNPYVTAGLFCKRADKKLKPWHMDTHLRVLSESYSINTNMTWFRLLSKIFASLSFELKKP